MDKVDGLKVRSPQWLVCGLPDRVSEACSRMNCKAVSRIHLMISEP